MSDRVKPLVDKVRDMVDNEIAPLDDEYHREIGAGGDRFALTPMARTRFTAVRSRGKN